MLQALSQSPATGAYCTLNQLIELRYAARKLDLRQRKRALSMLSGPNKTNFRGRGIDFEEVRVYQPGDDIRTIDWRITARTGEAHTKMFREERERQVLLAVDQRSSMFFGSQSCCKSVLAAHLTALLAWAALQRGDRLGGLVFSEQEHRETRPRRSRRSVLGLLNTIADMNAQLPLAATESSQDDLAFNDLLTELRRVARPGSALFIVSDFRGALEEPALEQIYQLSRHMEITALHCSDPLERELPAAGRYTVSNGQDKTDLYTGDSNLRQAFSDHFSEQLAALQQQYGKLGVPVIEASTAGAPLTLLQAYYADRSGRK